MVNEINKPEAKNGLTLIENRVKFTEDQEVAEFFKDFFCYKNCKVEGQYLHFHLKTVSEDL